MKGYKVSFNIYAETEEEALNAQNAIIGFIGEHAREGRAVSANKVVAALGKWKENPFVRNQIINYFK